LPKRQTQYIEEMSNIGATSTAAAFVEEDFITSIWTLLVDIRGELLMFAVAMVGYFVLFMMRPPSNPKLQTKKVEDDQAETRAGTATSKTLAKTSLSRKPSGGRSPTNSPPTTDIAKQINMIRSHAAEKNLAGACSVFESMEQSGIELNCIMYNTVLDACVECKDLQAADAWMERMVKEGMTDVVSFNTLIKASLQNGSFDKARRLMTRMTSEGLQPNQVTFNELMNAMVSKAGDGRRKDMWALVEEMKVADVKPNQVTISILLKCLNYHSSDTEVAKTFELIKTMDEVMDEVLLSSVVEACVRIGKPALLETQLKNLQDSTPITITGSHTYGSLIKAYGYAKDLTSIWRCWKEMRSRHIKPTSITMGCMVEAIVNNGDTEGAYDLIHEIKEDEQCRDVLNSIVYCSVLKGFTREKKIDRVWAVYQEMKDT
jgi:pentatricopeptide repeat protein